MSKLNIFNETKENLKDLKKLLTEIFKDILNKETFSVIFVDNDKIQQLNKTYRNTNDVTDVLSFISEEEGYLGDVFISIDKAKTQASDYGHSINREVGFLAVHGYLHLKGYLHETIEDEKKMNELTNQILEKANLKRGI